MGNSKKSEEAAVAAILSYFANSKRVDCNIPMNDKGLLWDDHLHFHSAEPFTKDNLIARIPVQVKGRSLKWRNEEQTFIISNKALQRYSEEGGIAYFVVDVANRTSPIIFYNLLTMVEIRRILSTSGDNRDVKVPVKRLTLSCDDFELLLLEFISDRQKQCSFAKQKLITHSQLLLLDSPTFEFSFPVSKEMNPIHSLAMGGYHHIYLKTKEGASIPLEDGPFMMNMEREVTMDVKVGNTTYYSSFRMSLGDGKTILNIGDRLFLSAEVSKDSIKFHSARYTMKNTTLSDKIREMAFIKALIELRELHVGSLEFYGIRLDNEEEILKTANANLTYWQRIQDTLKKLGVNKELILKNFTAEDFDAVDWLDKLFNKNYLAILEKDSFLFQRAKIGNINLLLSFEKIQDGAYKVGNAFVDKEQYRFPLKNTPSITMPIYSVIPAEGFSLSDNMPYEDIAESYKSIAQMTEDVLNLANLDILRMLEAYDSKPNKRLLIGIRRLADWLYSHDEFPHDIAYLNHMQILKRERNLTDDEIEALLNFAEDTSDNQFKLGAYILADDQRQGKRIFKRLNNQQKKTFLSFPISRYLDMPKT